MVNAPRTGAVRAVKMEALTDVDAPVRVELTTSDGGTVELAVNPPRRWRISALSAITGGDFEKWARGALASETDVELFFDTDPTVADIEVFMARLGEVMSEGKSKTSLPSTTRSKPTRKK